MTKGALLLFQRSSTCRANFHLSVILTDSPLIDGWIAVWKDKAGISELTRTPVTGSGIAPQDY